MSEHRNARWWHYILDSPKTAGFLACLALAIAFSPRASVTATWVCSLGAFVFGSLTVAGLRDKPVGLVVVSIALLATSLLAFGSWLSGKKSPSFFVGAHVPRI